MIIELPRGVRIDIDKIPENLEEIVQQTFRDYTHGTSKDYTFEDKLAFIDCMMGKIHHADAGNDVHGLIVERFEYELDDQGRLSEPEDFLNIEFMEDCYELGRKKAKLHCNHLTDDHHINEKVMKIIVRVITAVMNWEG